jgi:hypothetical protein
VTLPELATLALATLDAQQKYFKTRSRDDLIASKQLEKELRQAAEGALVANAACYKHRWDSLRIRDDDERIFHVCLACGAREYEGVPNA